MEVTSDRSGNLIVTEGLFKRSWQSTAGIVVRKHSGHGVEATEVSEARLDRKCGEEIRPAPI